MCFESVTGSQNGSMDVWSFIFFEEIEVEYICACGLDTVIRAYDLSAQAKQMW